MNIKEVSCKSLLNPSKLPGLDYCLNPYIGCQHACVYCYAREMSSPRLRSEVWGEFVDVKINASLILSREISKRKRGIVGLSTITDPYQPIEKQYEVTRKCLNVLLKSDFPISIQTKSSLVLRDIDLIKAFSTQEVGFTIITVRDELRRLVEPFSSPIEERLACLRELANHRVRTWAFVGPILPFVTDDEEDLRRLVSELKDARVEYVLFDRLNMKMGVWPALSQFLRQNYVDKFECYREIMSGRSEYFNLVKAKVTRICREVGIKCWSCY